MELLGVKIDDVSARETLGKIKEFLIDGRQHYIVTVNADFLVRARKDEKFRNVLNQADLSVVDGAGVVWAAKLLGESLREKISGVDLTARILNQESGVGENIFLLGGRCGVAEKIAKRYEKIVGFTEETGEEAIKLINRCQPQILFVALGSPKQELWIVRNLPKIPSVKMAMGIGGTFNFISGRVRRAPRWMRQSGFEWLWRAFREPWRWRQIWRSAIIFPLLTLKEKFL
ncbi:MAG: WecB/TagA/CpsF family glycosyltransferase [Candidatus Portnoybacteria bacterium]|jgi:N-acetylglucosaminyldiphosphoundecaprenol N-acetyl-beta-D-mannosaminyltransferase|nr:WecB/TagA/CpsF family glycosyltransferase [Candidatus Portnoybacteria bacterium]